MASDTAMRLSNSGVWYPRSRIDFRYSTSAGSSLPRHMSTAVSWSSSTSNCEAATSVGTSTVRMVRRVPDLSPRIHAVVWPRQPFAHGSVLSRCRTPSLSTPAVTEPFVLFALSHSMSRSPDVSAGSNSNALM